MVNTHSNAIRSNCLSGAALSIAATVSMSLKWILVIFIVPAIASLAWWSVQDRPSSWSEADWSATGILPNPSNQPEAVIHVLSARTGGLKGALSQHSWIVLKPKGAPRYDRYDKVGWGSPVRRNAYAADARWYSNRPQIVKTVHGKEAERLIPAIEQAILTYPHSSRGGYTIWPGPNSNSFVAHILREVPQIDAVLPPNAVGRDYLSGGKLFHLAEQLDDFKLGYEGLIGISIGRQSGFELNLLGLVAGIDILRPALKIPGFGRVDIKVF